MTFITQYNRKGLNSRVKKFDIEKYPCMVKKSLSSSTDINKIVEQYSQTGQLPLNGNQPLYDENYIKIDSLIEAKNVMNRASDYFNTLPANIRAEYGNDLMKFAKAVTVGDPKLTDLGVLPKPIAPETTLEPSIMSPSHSDVVEGATFKKDVVTAPQMASTDGNVSASS